MPPRRPTTSAWRVAAVVATAALLALAIAGLASGRFPWSGGGGGSGGGDDDHWKKPGFCGRMDCPRYSTRQKHYDYQLREYEEAYWVATNISATKYELAVKMATLYLMEYFWGANNQSLRMKETVPLSVHYRTDGDPHTGTQHNYTVALFIPYEYQEEPPQPNNTSVWLYRNPKATLAVRMFQHRAREGRAIEEMRALLDALFHAGHDNIETGAMMVASYDHPLKHHPHHRRYHHSEVWVRGDFKLSPRRASGTNLPSASNNQLRIA
ncbi:hypothetical protein ABPG75_001605 [Micractinium tetrahymenae]